MCVCICVSYLKIVFSSFFSFKNSVASCFGPLIYNDLRIKIVKRGRWGGVREIVSFIL